MTGAELALIASGVGTVANIGAGYFGGKDVANKSLFVCYDLYKRY